MTLFNKVIIVLFLLSFTYTVQAQKYYFTVATGYSIPSSKRTVLVTRDQQILNANLGSYGAGFNFNLGFEKSISSYMRVGFDVGVSIGNQEKGKTVSQIRNLDATVKAKSDAFYFTPYLYGEIPTGKRANVYVSWGLVFSKPSVNYEYFATNTYGAAQTALFSEKLVHKLGLGSRFGSGLSFVSGANDNITITLGLELITLTPMKDELELTKYILNGVDQLPTLSTSDKKINYDKSVKIGDPDTALADTSPFGSIGVKFGCKMKLIAKK